jgi:signal transduction histidine kinase
MDVVVTEKECRGRIAGELHDLVSHQVSIVTIQANAAQSLLARDPQAAVAALATVQTTAGEALDDVRRLQAVLRDTA